MRAIVQRVPRQCHGDAQNSLEVGDGLVVLPGIARDETKLRRRVPCLKKYRGGARANPDKDTVAYSSPRCALPSRVEIRPSRPPKKSAGPATYSACQPAADPLSLRNLVNSNQYSAIAN